jgi:hypothetical protein
MSDPISFACRACQLPIEAALNEVGRSKACPNCGEANTVPFPRVKVGGGFRPAPTPVAPPPAAPHAASPKPSAPPPLPDEEMQSAEKDVAKVIAQPLLQPRQSGTNRPGMYAAYAAVFVACVAGGWMAVSSNEWIDGLSERLSAMTGSEATEAASVPATKPIDITRHVEEVVMASRAARLARESIETDLNVSLAEMQSRGMQNEADVVRKAIERKTEQIKTERERASAALQALLRDIPGVAADKKSVLDAHLRKISLPLNAAESALLEKVGVEMASPGEGAEVVRKAMSAWDQSI